MSTRHSYAFIKQIAGAVDLELKAQTHNPEWDVRKSDDYDWGEFTMVNSPDGRKATIGYTDEYVMVVKSMYSNKDGVRIGYEVLDLLESIYAAIDEVHARQL